MTAEPIHISAAVRRWLAENLTAEDITRMGATTITALAHIITEEDTQ